MNKIARRRRIHRKHRTKTRPQHKSLPFRFPAATTGSVGTGRHSRAPHRILVTTGGSPSDPQTTAANLSRRQRKLGWRAVRRGDFGPRCRLIEAASLRVAPAEESKCMRRTACTETLILIFAVAESPGRAATESYPGGAVEFMLLQHSRLTLREDRSRQVSLVLLALTENRGGPVR